MFDEERRSAAVDKFLAEIELVCRKHNLSIGHEDQHGSFVIELFSDANIEWLQAASVDPALAPRD